MYQKLKTVIISTGVPTVPYLSAAMEAPVLPLHFLVSVNSTKEVSSILEYSSRSSASKFAKPGFGRESGTSISAALTAGATALFVNWGLQSDPPRYFTNREIKSLLIRGATRSSNLLYPNREWGYGTLNLYQIFQVLL